MSKEYFIPQWSNLPSGVKCLTTTRYADDDALEKDLGKNVSLQWLNQVHGNSVIEVSNHLISPLPEVDALYSKEKNIACIVKTADCLPVFFCDQTGQEIAVAHAGWRGLVSGVLENTVSKFKAKPEHILACYGPAIGQCHFEVGSEVRQAFIEQAGILSRQSKRNSVNTLVEKTTSAFQAGEGDGKWMANLFQLASARLNHLGINQISTHEICTICQKDKFFSYRDTKTAHRMANIIYRQD